MDGNRCYPSRVRAAQSPSCLSSTAETILLPHRQSPIRTLLFFSRQDFQALCLQHPQVALKVLRVVGGRLRRLVGIIEELSFTTVRHRLIALLVRLSKADGAQNEDAITLTLPVNNSELAAQIGTVRELVSRNLSRLQAEGLIQLDNRSLQIPSLKRLKDELQSSGG